MTRDIISDQTTLSPQAVPVRVEPAPAPAAVPPEPPARRDAIAAAFPAWDLVPAVPFVRRVK
jgi:hypothetical protein